MNSNQQGVELRGILDGRCTLDDIAAGHQFEGLWTITNVMEDELWRIVDSPLVDLHSVSLDVLQNELASVDQKIEGADNVKGLVVVDESSEVYGCH